ncbi:hypothetical protein SCHIN_v1c12240 [Spiroplasma chinense]|uniref:Uncharacterized protein n=2 Tax=Spiroplasma chinense TaxID=216932 RepID=A0A5B9Y7W1_9MOLU|nr:hypothetical protein SCHIN_v1c12240 [Spiroplasma chinense]
MNHRAKIKLAHKNESNEVIFFLENKIRIKLLEKTKEVIQNLLPVEVISIGWSELQQKNIVYVVGEKLVPQKTTIKISSMLKLLYKNLFDLELNVDLADYYQLYLGGLWVSEENLVKLYSECLRNRKTIYTLPLSKRNRQKYYYVGAKHTFVKTKSVICGAGKALKIYYKIDK